jgi:hypothetical protein
MRPKTTDTERKTSRYTIRLKPGESAELERQAEIAGLSASEFVRRCVFSGRNSIIAKTDMKMISELRRIGGLLKLSFHETGGVHAGKTALLLDDLRMAIFKMGRKEGGGQ